MTIYAVDDEPLLLGTLCDAIKEAAPDCELYSFMRATQVFKALEEGGDKPDAAFLDIELPGMGGLELDKRIKILSPHTWIVFVTGHSQYAVEAFAMHAKGYVMKPVTVDRIREKLTSPPPSALPSNGNQRVRVQAFGNFDVFVDGKPLKFARSKSKEVFAYLIHNKGARCTTQEIEAILFEDQPSTDSQRGYTQKVIRDMVKAFQNVGAQDALVRDYSALAVVPDKIDCDFYRFIRKEPDSFNTYTGAYMAQYSWAEPLNAELYEMLPQT